VNKIDIKQQVLLNAPVPVLPAGLNRLQQAFEDDNITHQKLAEIITNFPSIAARLIFLANSAWASPRFPVENLETACARLGFPMVRSVSISLCIISPFNKLNKCLAFDMEYFWCSALSAADAATMLASCAMNTIDLNTSTLHTAGLLHNLGLLWLVSHWPEQTSRALEMAAEDDSLSTLEALRSVIGTDYCEAGGILGRSWKLPEVLVSAMEQHGHGVYTESAYHSTMLVGYAVEMISSLRWGLKERPPFPEQTGINFDQTQLDEIYRKLGDKLNQTQNLARSMFSGF
jgi:HD-like signal output (HDOD) protein